MVDVVVDVLDVVDVEVDAAGLVVVVLLVVVGTTVVVVESVAVVDTRTLVAAGRSVVGDGELLDASHPATTSRPKAADASSRVHRSARRHRRAARAVCQDPPSSSRASVPAMCCFSNVSGGRSSGGGGGLGEGGLERFVVEAAEDGGRLAAGVDDDERGLDGDAEVLVELTVAVGELRKGELVAVDEGLERRVVAGPRDAVGRDLSVPALGDQFDRTGFGVADRSSRRPEPQQHGPPRQRAALELITPEDLRRERQRTPALIRGGGRRGVA